MNQELLVDIYDNYCNKFIFNNELIGLNGLFNQCIKEYYDSTFNFVFYFRIDLFLKDEFIKTFNVNWSKIIFPSICFKPYHINDFGDDRVNDTMMFIPKKYNMVLKNIEINEKGFVMKDFVVFSL